MYIANKAVVSNIYAMKYLNDLTEAEILAVAISSEEEDSQIYMNFANRLRKEYPATADMFVEMAKEEQGHKNSLIDMYKSRFGAEIPYITREDVKGFPKRNPIWLLETLRVETVRRQAEQMEKSAAAFYHMAAAKAEHADVRKLLGDLALIESGHANKAADIHQQTLETSGADEKNAHSKLFLMQVVQPGLTGLIDGSVSTLAPIFAAAFATHSSHETFLVGLAASLGSGISMGITEYMSDDGVLTGRGDAWLRGVVCGIMTTLGGLGHTLPYLIEDFWTATIAAGIIVVIELWAIAWIRFKYMETPMFKAIIQVVLGGALVLLTGVLVGGS